MILSNLRRGFNPTPLGDLFPKKGIERENRGFPFANRCAILPTRSRQRATDTEAVTRHMARSVSLGGM